MENMVGKRIMISGMVIEIISDAGERWEAKNTTTQETIFIDKAVIANAIKLAKAEIVSGFDKKNKK